MPGDIFWCCVSFSSSTPLSFPVSSSMCFSVTLYVAYLSRRDKASTFRTNRPPGSKVRAVAQRTMRRVPRHLRCPPEPLRRRRSLHVVTVPLFPLPDHRPREPLHHSPDDVLDLLVRSPMYHAVIPFRNLFFFIHGSLTISANSLSHTSYNNLASLLLTLNELSAI